jgi:hypothetical protein
MKLNLLAKFLLAATLALCQLHTQAASQKLVAAENGMVVRSANTAQQTWVRRY